METIGIIAILLLLASSACLILGLIQPKIFSRFYKNGVNRKKTSLIFGSILIICLIPIGFLSAGTPSLAKMKTPTNQKTATVSGKTSYKNATIKVYLNGEVIKELKSDDKGNFSTPVDLREGENKIKVSATNDKSKTQTSTEIKVVLDLTPPNLEIDSPQSPIDSDKFTLKGKSEKSAQVIVYSGDKELKKTKVEKDSFEIKDITLNEGENRFTIKAIDEADNYSSAKEIAITYIKPVSKEETKTEPPKQTGTTQTESPSQTSTPTSAPTPAEGVEEAMNDEDLTLNCVGGDKVVLWDKPTDYEGGARAKGSVPCGTIGFAENKFYNEKFKKTFYDVTTNDNRIKNVYGWVTEDFITWK